MAVTVPEERVVELFALFSDMDGEALERWRGLCATATGQILSRLREDADGDGESEALCAAAAAWAFCDYLMVQTVGGNTDEVRVGDISLKSGAGGQDRREAEEIRDHFLAQVSHLLRRDCPLIAAGGDK